MQETRWVGWIPAVKTLLLPPGSLIWLGLGGWLLGMGPAVSWGNWLVGASLGGLFLLGMPVTQQLLFRLLDRYPPLVPRADLLGPGAIVVLDAGRQEGAREFAGDTAKPLTLERLHYCAWLYRQLAQGQAAVPVLVSGNGAGPLMVTLLRESYGVPVAWCEPHSRNTHQNAQFSAALLRAAGITHVVLVTHFWHLPRAAAAFRQTGLRVTPAPLGFAALDRSERGLLALVPRATAWQGSYLAFHEWIGLAWYTFRYLWRKTAQGLHV